MVGTKTKKTVLILLFLSGAFLRLWRISDVPVSLFGDELDVGYHAYSILKTGKDYYGNPWPTQFHSIAEWRTPLYLYSVVPSVRLFGITPLGVRLPASLFGIVTLPLLYLLVKKLTNDDRVSMASVFVMTFSPWHIQYSRAGFEVAELIFLLILGLYLFLKSISSGKWLWVSVASFALMPWVYSTAKLFSPLMMFFLFLVWRREILSLPKKYLIYAVLSLIVIGFPVAYGTFFGGGTQRFNYISVFSDPTIEPEVGTARQADARARGEMGTGLNPTVLDKVFHNKVVFWVDNIGHNYFQALSSDFLFNEGDPNPRHSTRGIGQFYKVEVLGLVLGLSLFFAKFKDRKIKLLVIFWIMAGVFPSALTRDGGNHATRLILVLPPLVFLIAYGLSSVHEIFPKLLRFILYTIYFILFSLSFVFYQHNYWVHNPTDSERWWHAGYQEAIQSVKAIDSSYDRVVISSAGEPPWIFFAGWYEYPPDLWQKNFPIGNDIELPGFGKVSHIDKFYFGSPSGGVYDWGKVMDKNILYLAVAREVNVNLIMEPGRTPNDLVLLKSIAYPSGEPAFYLFRGK